MDEEYNVIECILSGLLTSQWTVSRSIEILSEQLLGEISRALKPLILPQGKGIRLKSLKIGSSFALKKTTRSLPKVQINDGI
ncbi:hypothetical protein Pyn_19231 [Prunus yedoensis var. nudiflora]|uniref:Uncharacterized protein n=1 Tax=Prunus yedoensis var. nudiflora TaxID=2094558 RepID=A0A314U7G2_PRUYE|nr:hypothetical protein Pyn_19231 [Prunus yedoensis var. nudiflora]